MFSKKIAAILGSIVLLTGIVGGVIAVEDRYAKCFDVAKLEKRIDRKILRDDIRDYQRQLWDMERNYGKEVAKEKREYKEIEYKKQELEKELNKR